MEYKLLTPEFKINNSDVGSFEGYCSTFGNWDAVKERPVKGAFTPHLAEFLDAGFIAIGHDWSSLPIATPTSAREDDHGLLVTAEFHSHPEAQAARAVMTERLARGKSVKLSIGYEVLADEYVPEGRLLKELKLYEFSLVTVPANTHADVMSAKGLVPDAMPLDQHSDAVLATVGTYFRRLKGLSDLRAKENRVLSEANRNRIKALQDALTGVMNDLQALLDLSQPKADPTKARQLYAEFLYLEAQLHGAIL